MTDNVFVRSSHVDRVRLFLEKRGPDRLRNFNSELSCARPVEGRGAGVKIQIRPRASGPSPARFDFILERGRAATVDLAAHRPAVSSSNRRARS